MVDLDTREWLLTNGLGSFASGTVSDVRTRTYHGWLFAATDSPFRRTLLLSHLEASLELPNQTVALGTNFWGAGQIEPRGYQRLRCFDLSPVPKWIWGEDNWQLTRQMMMPHSGGQRGQNRLLIRYCYEGEDIVTLRLRLLIAERDFHNQQKAIPELQFSQMLGQQQVCLQAIISGKFGIPWLLRWTQGDYQPDAVWYWNYNLPEETQRFNSDREDLYSPGYLTVILTPGDAVTIEAQVSFPHGLQSVLTSETFASVLEKEQERFCEIFGGEGNIGTWGYGSNFSSLSPSLPVWRQLLKAADQFIVPSQNRENPVVIASYHWLLAYGRDTLIALPGLALVPQRFDLAKGLLRTLGSYCRYGLIPNAFPDLNTEPLYNNIDVPLWWIETLGLYLKATRDWKFLREQYPVVQQIYKAFIGGTRYNIQVDAIDGLVSWDTRGVALTWMNAVVDGQPVTSRRGKPVEINALWYSALCWASRWAEILSEQEGISDSARLAKQAQRYTQHARAVKVSLQKFWNSQQGYLYDTIDPDDQRNSQIRPNAVLALSLSHCGFSQNQGRQILELAASCLLTPYGLRTLAPSDPEYIGKCVGHAKERDYAYYQGTVWSWLIGPFMRASKRFDLEESQRFDWQPLLDHFLNDACLGSISQIFDGDAPHKPRGAIAHAASVGEVISVLSDL